MANDISTTRWHLKKIARQVVSRSSLALRRAGATVPVVRVLTYHRFGVSCRDPFCISPSDFESQASFLANKNLAISLGEFLEYLDSPSSLVRDKVLLTIDDGFQSTARIAQPILEHYAVPSVAFLSPGLIGTANADDIGAEPYMTWPEVENTADSLMRVGSHSLKHESYGRLSPNAARHDAEDSKRKLEAHLDYEVTSFAYPYGTQRDYNSSIADIVGQSGYKAAFTSFHGAVGPSASPLELPRVKVESGDSLEFFARLTNGAMDSWSLVDKYLSRLQANS